jgi:hypothetical protein
MKTFGVDATSGNMPSAKERALQTTGAKLFRQKDFTNFPDSRIVSSEPSSKDLVSEYADFSNGIQTGDSPRFIKSFWEVENQDVRWEWQQSTVQDTTVFGGLRNVLYWEDGGGELVDFIERKIGRSRIQSWLRGTSFWGQRGVAVSSTGNIMVSLYTGEAFDDSTMVLCPKDPSNLSALWTYCQSPDYEEEVRSIDKKLNVRSALGKVPFDLDHWKEVAEEEYPDGLPDPYSDDPTQWIFHGHPKPSERPLQVAVARLLGYRWPAERDDDMDLADEARDWIARAAELDDHVDDDGIVCIPAVQGERKAVDRLRDLLVDAWGEDWSEDVLNDLLDEHGYKGRGLAAWLSGEGTPWGGKFAKQHNQLFGNRPFIWHVSDAHEEGFSALVNYHQLDKATLERLTYTYLGDWIEQQKSADARGDEGAEAKLLAAQDLQAELKKIIEGEPPYDIFVRWKEAHEQPIGWNPDLNDGVLLNIKPFIEGDGRPGVLRDEPNVRYTKDRGKNPEGAPWGPKRYNRYEDVPDEHKLKDEDGDVIEHLTNEVKRRVRRSQ